MSERRPQRRELPRRGAFASLRLGVCFRRRGFRVAWYRVEGLVRVSSLDPGIHFRSGLGVLKPRDSRVAKKNLRFQLAERDAVMLVAHSVRATDAQVSGSGIRGFLALCLGVYRFGPEVLGAEFRVHNPDRTKQKSVFLRASKNGGVLFKPVLTSGCVRPRFSQVGRSSE